jgi:pyrroline-5-carboxylate reductase
MRRIVLVGGGNMGEALIAGLIRSRRWKPSQITVTDVRPEALQRLQKAYRVRTSADNRWAARDADIILLAVKPQQMKHVLEDLGPVLRQKQMVISIAAGVTTEFIERYLANGVPTLRAMPNTPALIGEGASGLARGRWAKPPHERIAEGILRTVGLVVAVSEKDLDAVTALSGSGPAYVFLVAEAMLEAGVALGLAPQVADRLVRQTIRGAGRLLAESHEGPQTLRQRVTSPGGTTEAALKIFESAKLKRTFLKALKRASARSEELAKAL